MYSQVHDITMASLLLANQKMAAQNPAARERVSRAVTDWSSARLANMVSEHPDPVRQRVAAEQGAESQEERALAERPPGALRGGLKQRVQQTVPIVGLIAQVQPDEVVLLEPGQQSGPVKRQAEDGRNRPISGGEQFPLQRKIIAGGGRVGLTCKKCTTVAENEATTVFRFASGGRIMK